MALGREVEVSLSPAERIEDLKAQFTLSMAWDEKYRKIIQWSRDLAPLADSERTDDVKVKGCQSQVWLLARIEEGKVFFRGDSDALIVKGLVGLLIRMYSGLTPAEILALKPDFLKELGFESHLSPSRANGLFAMAKQIHYYAIAYQAWQSQSSS